MKKLTLTFISVLIVSFLAKPSFAEDMPYPSKEMPLGESTLSISIDGHTFTHDDAAYYGLDSGIGTSVEGYLAVAPKIYIGASLGYAISEGSFIWMDSANVGHKIDTELTYTPVEVNAKYLIELSPELLLSLGGGFSKNYLKEKRAMKLSGVYTDILRTTDTVSGHQLFAEVVYRPKYDNYFVALKGLSKKMGSLYHFKRDYSHNSVSLLIGYYY